MEKSKSNFFTLMLLLYLYTQFLTLEIPLQLIGHLWRVTFLHFSYCIFYYKNKPKFSVNLTSFFFSQCMYFMSHVVNFVGRVYTTCIHVYCCVMSADVTHLIFADPTKSTCMPQLENESELQHPLQDRAGKLHNTFILYFLQDILNVE